MMREYTTFGADGDLDKSDKRSVPIDLFRGDEMFNDYPSYVCESFREFLDDLEEEVKEQEIETLREGEDNGVTDDELRAQFRRTTATVGQILRGKSGWLAGGRRQGPLYFGHAPSWYLDYQRELVAMKFAREWTGQLDHVVSRLMQVPTLVLPKGPPTECRICLEEATRCFVQGLFRAAAVLSRTALEVALRDRLQTETRGMVSLQQDQLRELIERSKRVGLLRGDALEAAYAAKRVGNGAAHGAVIGMVESSEVVGSVRTVVGALYGGKPEPEGVWYRDPVGEE